MCTFKAVENPDVKKKDNNMKEKFGPKHVLVRTNFSAGVARTQCRMKHNNLSISSGVT